VEIKVQHVNRNDLDFQQYMTETIERYNCGESITAASLPDGTAAAGDDNDQENNAPIPEIYFSVDEAKQALMVLTNDASLSSMIASSDQIGYNIWKEASSSPAGVHISTLVMFATCELRMRQLERFVGASFPKSVLRERQDTKARYEVDCDGMKISSIFACIEENKDRLRLSDYCVSQTSLEQVFNMHAAEAERCKHHQIDG
jgi:hypothetical protein